MFRPNTLFIIGAGASCEAGLPSGAQVKAQIAGMMDISFSGGRAREQTSGDPQITNCLREAVRNDSDPKAFHRLLLKAFAIRDGLPLALSIDNYLDAHRGDHLLEFVGKLGIAKSILDAESGGLMAPSPGQRGGFLLSRLSETWYLRFVQLLTENVARKDLGSAIERVSIITFNYDRTILHFLRQALSTYYQMPEQDVEEALKKLRIYHPYGKVGDLPWQSRKQGVAFGDADKAKLIQVSGYIRTFTEQVQEGAILASLRNSVQKAEITVFLGFGFHQQNIRLMRPLYTEKNQRVYATVLGISASDQRVIRRDLEDILGVGPTSGRIQQGHVPSVEFFGGTCAQLLDEYRRTLTER